MARTALSRAEAAAYVDKFASAKVFVLGDVMLDRYFWGRVDRISPEAPVPVVRVNRRSARLGGAANVAANLRALGVGVALAGVTGDDRAGLEVRKLLESRGIDAERLVLERGGETTEKVRIIAQSQQVVRADFEAEPDAWTDGARRMLSGLAAEAAGYDALVISDYGKGVIERESLGELVASWRSAGRPVLIDPHVGHFHWYRGATVVTPNTKEAASFFGPSAQREDLFDKLGYRMLDELGLDALLVTRGEEGMTLFLGDGGQIHIPTVATEVYDVTGAGDTVIGVLGAAVACGAPMLDAVILANQAAGEVVKEVGTSVITSEKLLSALPESVTQDCSE